MCPHTAYLKSNSLFPEGIPLSSGCSLEMCPVHKMPFLHFATCLTPSQVPQESIRVEFLFMHVSMTCHFALLLLEYLSIFLKNWHSLRPEMCFQNIYLYTHMPKTRTGHCESCFLMLVFQTQITSLGNSLNSTLRGELLFSFLTTLVACW